MHTAPPRPHAPLPAPLPVATFPGPFPSPLSPLPRCPGAEVNYAIPDGRTGLTQAAKNGHLSTVRAFIAATPNEPHKHLALQFAERQGHAEVAAALSSAMSIEWR